MAKYNLETRYSVVGLIEHFNTSIAVMEQYLPGKASRRIIHFHMYWIFSAFFSGATTRIKNTSHKANRNPHPTPSNQIMYANFNSFDIIFIFFTFRDILRRRLQLDIDFYEFAKQRLFSQWNSIIHLQSKSVESWEKRNIGLMWSVVWKVTFVILLSVVTFIFSSDPSVHKHPRHPPWLPCLHFTKHWFYLAQENSINSELR